MAKVKPQFHIRIIRNGRTVWLNCNYGWSRSARYAKRFELEKAKNFRAILPDNVPVYIEPAPPKAKYGSHMPEVKPITMQQAFGRGAKK